MNNINDYLKNIDLKNFSRFTNKIDSNINIEKDTLETVSDISWIDMVEDAIPYLDNIIRNPRRFIEQEENIVPIEKAKFVTEESIKHLAQNTGLIQDVDEDGNVIPLKLLNVYREETYDLYENRFIKSLIDNLYSFVNKKLNESDQHSFTKVKSKVTYNGRVNLPNENVDISLQLNSSYNDNIDNSKNGQSLDDRISHIKDVIAGFMSSKFIKSLKSCMPVRSPIRKTNVILKEPNFIKALELWEYLEKNNIKPITSTKSSHEVVSDDNIKSIYDTTFYINNDVLKNHKIESSDFNYTSISKMLNQMVFSCDYSEKEIHKILNKELRFAIKNRNKIETKITTIYKGFFASYERNKKNALKLLR